MNEIERLQKRIADLEDALEPLLPYAECDNWEIQGKFRKDAFDATSKYQRFKRDAMFIDQGVFRQIKKLMEKRG